MNYVNKPCRFREVEYILVSDLYGYFYTISGESFPNGMIYVVVISRGSSAPRTLVSGGLIALLWRSLSNVTVERRLVILITLSSRDVRRRRS